jgi:hypothetical protein
MPTALALLFEKWRTDKATCTPGPFEKAECNGYAGLYECLFSRLRYEVKSVLEVGIGTMVPDAPSSMVGWALPGYRPGGSLRAWQEYFVNATIVGLDIQHDTQFDNVEKIITRLCDSTCEDQVRQVMQDPVLPRKFDIIIDDACHYSSYQIATMRNLFPYLRQGGFYIVEDIHQNSFMELVNPLRNICGESPFFLAGPNRNLLVVMKRRRAAWPTGAATE